MHKKVQRLLGLKVLNEEKSIADCIRYLQSLEVPPSQILVVDGGSIDRWELILFLWQGTLKCCSESWSMRPISHRSFSGCFRYVMSIGWCQIHLFQLSNCTSKERIINTVSGILTPGQLTIDIPSPLTLAYTTFHHDILGTYVSTNPFMLFWTDVHDAAIWKSFCEKVGIIWAFPM